MTDTAPPELKQAASALLAKLLATASDLSLQAKHAHWNVQGPGFIAVHELFDDVASAARGWSDDIAERIAALGGVASGTSMAIVSETALPHLPLAIADQTTYCAAIAQALSTLCGQVTEIAQGLAEADIVTSNLLQDIAAQVDKKKFLVSRHITGA